MPKRHNDKGPTKPHRSEPTLEKLQTEKRARTPGATRFQSSRQKLKNDLREGYLANAASARAVAEKMMSAEVE